MAREKGKLEALEKVRYFVHSVNIKATASEDIFHVRATWWTLLKTESFHLV